MGKSRHKAPKPKSVGMELDPLTAADSAADKEFPAPMSAKEKLVKNSICDFTEEFLPSIAFYAALAYVPHSARRCKRRKKSESK
jgi:hypothetical protein